MSPLGALASVRVIREIRGKSSSSSASTGYATGAGVEPHPGTPYGFVVLPRTDKRIVLEQDEASHKAVTPTPPDWQEAARLTADTD